MSHSKHQVKLEDPLHDDDKIAIIGIGCRYGDGVAGPLQMWDMLIEGRDCTGSHPQQRFDKSTFFFPGEKKKGKLYTKAGGYIKQNPLTFDRHFFKMSPDEANHMDPQVRILLEVVWESIADAGLAASTLRGSNTGVYMGVTANEYFTLTSFPQSNIGQYTNSGTNSCMISNRVSYEFDLRGPSFTIDTACSSSLYAVQIACDALRGGVCDTAIAGGVNIILTPLVTIGFCQAGMLSPDGQCKSFDESANGYSRSEGVGSVVLKPLKKAMADGDRIYAVIRGGALTNDGRTPGIANPSFDAQIDLVNKACAAAKIDPRDVAYIEAHGTGTPVGDKTEANAIGEAMSKQRSDDMPPLYIGSIKSNVGHAEGAAGIAGVIKTALSLYYREIPGVAHFKRGNPNINFKDLKLRVPPKSIPWPTRSKFLAGCSSFGFGGANAHIVLEASQLKPCNSLPNTNDSMTNSDNGHYALLLSANSKEALKQRCSDWIAFLTNNLEIDSSAFINALYTANVRSHRHVDRIVVLAKSRSNFVKLLRENVKGNANQSMVMEGKAPEGNSINRTVFVFSGMGTQWWGMARELMTTQPIFNKVIQTIDETLFKYGAKWSLVHVLSEENDKERINTTEISQTCICSVQIALVELYKHYGVTPSAIIGHSVGEVAAAYAAGLLTMTAAIRIIFTRGRLLMRTTGSGTMSAVLHNVDDIQIRLKSTLTDLDVAAVNSPSQLVISGTKNSIKEFTSKLTTDGIQVKELKVNNAFHSRQQEVLKKEFYKRTSFLKKSKPSSYQKILIPMMSTVTNRYLTLKEANETDYWWSNIRQQVRFKDAVESLLKDGYNSFLEIGAHPALSPAIKDIIASTQNTPTIYFVTHSLKRPRDLSSPANDVLNFKQSLAQMCVNGYPVDMKPFFDGYNCEVASLPLYPWQRIECSATTEATDIFHRYPNAFHPLLGEPETSSNYSENSLRVWKAKIGTNKEQWISDHVLQSSIVLPAAGFVETAIAAYRQLFTDSHRVLIRDLEFDRFLFVSESETFLETTIEIEPDGKGKFTLYSFNNGERKWMAHTTMNLIPDEKKNGEQTMYLPVDMIKSRCRNKLSKAGFYDILIKGSFNLGKSFTCVENAYYTKVVDEAIIHIRAPDTVTAQSNRFNIHPALLDGILQVVGCMEILKISNSTDEHESSAPRAIKSVQIINSPGTFPTDLILHYMPNKAGGYDVVMADADTNAVIGKFESITFGSVAVSNKHENLVLWEKQWVQIYPVEHVNDDRSHIIVTGNDDELKKQLSNSLSQAGKHVTTVKNLQVSETVDPPSDTVIVFKPSNKNSLEKISKDELLNQQSDIAHSCIQMYNTLSTNKNERKPRMWIITRDGLYVKEDENVDPTQASAYGFALCVMQEDPSFQIFILDVPSNINSRTASKWLIDYIWKTEHCDNIVALRMCQPKHHSNRPYNAFSLRLNLSKTEEFKYRIASSDWKFDIDRSFQTGTISLNTTSCDDDRQHTTNLAVKVKAFHLMKTTSDNANSPQNSALFCGEAGKNYYIGICGDKELKSKINLQSDDVVKLNKGSLRPEEIVNIILKYSVPFGVLQNVVVRKASKTVVCMSSNTDKNGLAMAHIAAEFGHNIVVAVKNLSEKNGVHMHADHTVNIVDSNQVPLVLEDHSVTTLIGCESIVRELLQLCNMNKKFKPFASIVIIGSDPSTATKLRDIPKTAVVQTTDYNFYRNAQLKQMRPIIDDLLQFVEQPSSKLIQLKNDVVPEVISLQDIGSLESISFNDMTVAVGVDPVLTSYDFFEGDIVFYKHESYLVTGGTKGFGLCLVEWLSNNGAGCVFILSRTAAEPEENERLDALKKNGTKIVHIKTDITSRSEVETAFKQMTTDGTYQLTGIFHCAAQYDDKLLNDITPTRWKNVMAAKSWGALLLHQTSIAFNVQIKYFVMISSIVQLLGNIGQASYCAANTFLSLLGSFRRSNGLPATVFSPGVIKSDGYAARAGLVQFWDRKGIEGLPPKDLLNGLGVFIRSEVNEMGLSGNIRLRDYILESKFLVKEHISIPQGRFSILKGFDVSTDEMKLYIEDGGKDFITENTPEESRKCIFNKLCDFISKRLGIDSQISPDLSPSSLGVDSLMTTELSGFIQSTFSVFVPTMELMNANVSLQALTASIYKKASAEKKNGDEDNDNQEVDTSWKAWYIMDESIASPEIQLVCFPPNGGGPSAYAWWQNNLGKYKVQLIMAQLPGWEGRHLEKPLQTMEEITNQLTDNLAPRLIPGKFVLFGHSLGGLIAFEVAHRLIQRKIRPAHMIISSWYAPTLEYPNMIELEKAPSILRQIEENLQNNIPVTDNKTLRLSFVDDDVLGNKELMRHLIPCFHVGLKICQMYRNAHRQKLQCGMTIFGAKSDRFIPTSTLDAWCLEIDSKYPFKKILVPGGHMHITRAKKKFFQEIQTTLKKCIHYLD